MSLIVTKKGQRARAIPPAEILQEGTLQDFVVENPECLQLDELRSDLRLVIVGRELPTGSGYIDAAAVDDQGHVYLIETKLFRNPDKRRVLAQVLDYGASLWSEHGDPRTFLEMLDSASKKLPHGRGLDELLSQRFEFDEEQTDDFVRNVEEVVRTGGFRFVILLDRLDDRLKDLVSFINENSNFDVYAVELELYRFDDYEAVIPRLYGAEVRKVVPTSPRAPAWNEDRYFADARAKLSPHAVAGLRRLYAFVKDHADRVTWGTGRTTGSFNPKYDHIGPRSVFTAYSHGRIEWNFRWLHEAGEPLPAPIRRLADRLNAIPGLELPEGFENAHPPLREDVWLPRLDAIIAALGETLRTS